MRVMTMMILLVMRSGGDNVLGVGVCKSHLVS